ncbi:MAG: glycine dehydrogenase, partial [Candidatus Aminicenantes bacterium]|nr:glycine dehydrogenase [Candidatus Aminicenantes bacterium]
SEPLSLGLLQPPGELQADIVAGEAQSFGIPVSFGGPHIGFMACSMDFVRQFPGRISGQTNDQQGRRGFVLTLSTREQHIRRERATSNICTNQAWCALRTTIFLEALGKKGLKEMAFQNIQKANYALDVLSKINGVKPKFSGSFFNEFVIEFEKPWEKIEKHLLDNKMVGGLSLESFYPELKNCVLFCVTEKHTKAEIDKLGDLIRDSMQRID